MDAHPGLPSIFKSYLQPLTLNSLHFVGQTSGLQLNGRIVGFNAQSRSFANQQRMKQKTLSKPSIPTKQNATKNDELPNWGLGSITQTRNTMGSWKTQNCPFGFSSRDSKKGKTV